MSDDDDRVIELSVEVPGTPEEVWRAIATGPGISSWFVPHEVEERAGGRVSVDFGDHGSGTATVTVWDPPHRIVIDGTDQPGGLAFEWLVEAAPGADGDGGSCIVRLVNSGFGTGEEWDDQFDGMAEGWRIFLANLRLQRTHFPGHEASPVIPTVLCAGPNRDAWARLSTALGIDPAVGEGTAVRTRAGAPPLAGRVAAVIDRPIATARVLVLDEPVPGTTCSPSKATAST
jgi:uncharacterized protein YndB with AHSA1/START domain